MMIKVSSRKDNLDFSGAGGIVGPLPFTKSPALSAGKVCSIVLIYLHPPVYEKDSFQERTDPDGDP